MKQKTITKDNTSLTFYECEDCGHRQHEGNDCYKCRCEINEYHRDEALAGLL
jgi:hypothetical protein